MISATHRKIVITPIFEDAEASSRLFQELSSELGTDLYIIAVDDGSPNSPVKIESLKRANTAGVILRLRRNVGHQKAIAVGLSYAFGKMSEGDTIVIMDSDGEDEPRSVQALLAELGKGRADVIFAQRRRRTETLRFKIFYSLYKRFFQLMTGRRISFGNFMVMNWNAAKRLSSLPEFSIHVASATISSRIRVNAIPMDRGTRYCGKSKMNFVGLVLHGFRGLMVFAEDVLVRVCLACAIIASLILIGAAAAVFLKIIGFSTPGWFSIALGIMVLMLLQTGTLALMLLMLAGTKYYMPSPTATNLDLIERVMESDDSK